jgi:phosphate transport system substrate-binding protein
VRARLAFRCGVALVVAWAAGAEESSLRIAGSGTVAPLARALAEAQVATTGGAPFAVEARGTSTGPPALLSGRVDLAMLSRPLRKAERRAFERRFGAAPDVHPLALDMVVVMVHPSNPIDGLTLQQVDAIFSSTRRCGAPATPRLWGEAGVLGAISDRRILPFGRNERSGTHAYFREVALCGGAYRDDVRNRPGPESVRLSVSESPLAIGYGSATAHGAGEVKRLALSRDGGRAVTPTAENARTGAYPLVRTLWLASRPGEDSQAVVDFLAFVASPEGARIVEAEGYLPVSASR